MNDNELLKHVKSVKYLETRNYHDMLELMSAPFQVFVMGHSCEMLTMPNSFGTIAGISNTLGQTPKYSPVHPKYGNR